MKRICRIIDGYLKSLYKSLNKSLQIIRSITINNKNSEMIFQKNADVRRVGVSENSDTCRKGGRRGLKNGQKFSDVYYVYEWPPNTILTSFKKINLKSYQYHTYVLNSNSFSNLSHSGVGLGQSGSLALGSPPHQ